MLTALLLSVLAAAPDAPPVRRAVVYPDRALVTRALDGACGETPTSVVFHGLPAGLDRTAVSASASGSGARVEGVSLVEQVVRTPYRKEVEELDAQLEALDEKLRVQRDEVDRALAEKAQAESLRTSMTSYVNREAAAEKKPNVEAWRTGLDSVRELLDDASGKRRKAEIALRDLERQRAEVQRKRSALAVDQPLRTLDAEVLVRCASSGRATVELGYFVGGVSWAPVYEARTDEAAGKLLLTVAASVTQATGEEWRDVELTLSTATSRRDARPPEPMRMYVSASEREDKKKVLVRRDEEVRHVESVDAVAPTGGETVAAADQGLSVQLRVPGKVDVPGDGRPMRYSVETLPMPAQLRLFTAPKLLPHVFRAMEATSTARYPLLAGRVELFSGPSYVGAAMLERTAQNDKLKLAFGIDENVKVRRVVVQEEAKEPGLLSSTRRLVFAYRIELASFDPRARTVVVEEHIPVPQLDDVKVVVDPKTSRGYAVEKEDGIVRWTVNLGPKESKNLELRFAVEIPDKYDSAGL